jgi:outer membrane protein OmpA-like peptidoglycan-associated protein
MLDNLRDGLQDLADNLRYAFDDRPWLKLGSVVAAAAVVGGCVLGVSKANQSEPAENAPRAAHHIVYTAPTANDAAVQLPQRVRDELVNVGMDHGTVALTRVESTGATSTEIIDLTPRVSDDPDSPALKVPERAREAATAKVVDVEKRINAVPATQAGRALYTGLTKVDLTDQDITIISSGLDLAAPVDFRTLNWTVDPSEVVKAAKDSGELPALSGSTVTFVAVPAVGAQEQLRQRHKQYRDSVWTGLMHASGATSVAFVDAVGDRATSTTAAPAVELTDLPGTPISPKADPQQAKRMVCPLPGSTYFKPDTADLVDAGKTQADLEGCIKAAVASRAGIKVDGWTAYDGALTADGKPAVDSPHNRALSTERCQAIVRLLVSEMGVPADRITEITGHGNTDQPNPDPRSADNRLVVVSYITA